MIGDQRRIDCSVEVGLLNAGFVVLVLVLMAMLEFGPFGLRGFVVQ
jgi:hypothetical protein